MSIKCGNHTEKTYHETVADVRACFAGAVGGEQTYGDVILTSGELAKIADGIKQMESDGILPRSNRPAFASDTARTATAPVGYMARTEAVRTSPKGHNIPAEYGGSPKQFDYLYSMLEELGQLEGYDWSLLKSVRHASVKIESAKDEVRDARRLALANRTEMPAKREPVRQTVTGQVTEDGIYRNPATGELFKVQVAVHGSGQLYAKQAIIEEGDWHDGAAFTITNIPLEGENPGALNWVYKPGLLGKIKAEWKVTREEAVAFGALYGECIRCGRTLTNEDSIEAAIGPVCRGKMGF